MMPFVLGLMHLKTRRLFNGYEIRILKENSKLKQSMHFKKDSQAHFRIDGMVILFGRPKLPFFGSIDRDSVKLLVAA